jgi:hypothetical protein
MLKEDFSNIFVRFDSLGKLVQGFKSSDAQIWVNSLTTWHNIYQSESPLPHPKNIGRDFSAEVVALTSFFWGEGGWCYTINCLSVVQSGGSMFYFQWWPVIESFYHQPHFGGTNLNTPLSAQYYDIWFSFMEPNKHTFFNILRHQ